MLKHDIGFFKASDSIHLNPYESQLSSASDKYNPSYPRLLMLNLGKYSADAPLHNRANDINPFINYKFRIASYKLVAHRAMLNYVIINLKFTVYKFAVYCL